MLISFLPDEKFVPLDEAGEDWAGLVAVVRPLDTQELGTWADDFPTAEKMRTAAIAIVRQQLIRIDALRIGADPGVPFDPKIELHFRSTFSAGRSGANAISIIYKALLDRSKIDEGTEKNSASPSASDGTSGTAP